VRDGIITVAGYAFFYNKFFGIHFFCGLPLQTGSKIVRSAAGKGKELKR
jgi:hypothetical protein